ncbi:MAG TPA: alternative ribosome rescue aminoacyl-tRNA hydrolase ArfB [Phycisphaerales bacterium]|jgi:ribosome-associated protein|nr:alternative ribosome rescue aminoacyl-tRNA hydrolase ArfB [Phycisphaerales bacterium]
MIHITPKLSIPIRELKFVASTSSGPGGQHVNRVATKIVLLWDVKSSTSISRSQQSRILNKLATRINKAGILRVSSSKHRSQKANRSATIDRFILLLQDALKRAIARKRTNISRTQKAKRLEQKKRRSTIKSLRKPPKHE